MRPVVRALPIFADAQRQGVLGFDPPVQQLAQQRLLDLLVLGVFPEVHELVGVAVAVIQLAVSLPRVVGQLVMAAGDGLDVEAPVVAGELGEGVFPPCAAVAPQDGRHRHALHAVGGAHAGKVQQRGHDVHMFGDLLVAGAAGDHAGPGEDHRRFDQAVVMEGALEQQAVVPHQFPVVVGEKDQGVVGDALVPQRLQDAADVVVYQRDHAVVGGLDLAPLVVGQAAVVVLFVAAALADAVPAEMRRLVVQFALLPHGQRQLVGVVHGGVGRGRVKGMVRVHKAAQRKERLVGGGLFDQVDHAVGDPGRLMVAGVDLAGVDLGRAAQVLVGGAGAVLLRLALPLHLDDLVVLLALLFEPGQVLAGLAVAGGVHHVEAVAVGGPVVLLVFLGDELGGEMHLADGRGAVAVVAQHFRQADLLVAQGDAVVARAVVLGVAPGDDRAARRRTDGVLDKMVVEGGTVEGQAVDVGGVDLVVAIAAQRVEAHLVRHHQNDIGAFVHDYHHLIRSVTLSRSLLKAMPVTSRGRGRSLTISSLMPVGLLVSTRMRWLR